MTGSAILGEAIWQTFYKVPKRSVRVVYDSTRDAYACSLRLWSDPAAPFIQFQMDVTAEHVRSSIYTSAMVSIVCENLMKLVLRSSAAILVE